LGKLTDYQSTILQDYILVAARTSGIEGKMTPRFEIDPRLKAIDNEITEREENLKEKVGGLAKASGVDDIGR
jgi:hypothetical protein